MLRIAKTGSEKNSEAPQAYDGGESSMVINSEDSSLVGESESSDSASAPSHSGVQKLRMNIRQRTITTSTESVSEDSGSPPEQKLSPEHPPMLIVRTDSVRRGRKTSFRVLSEELKGSFTYEREVRNGKALSEEVQRVISDYQRVTVDLSKSWSRPDSMAGARPAAVAGLLAGGNERKLTIDLSNYRLSNLREGARIRSESLSDDSAWHKAFRDDEAAALVDALCRELVRATSDVKGMPEFALICRDQPLSGAVYPLLKTLATHAAALRGLTKLDLSRYSRSAEVCEARMPTDQMLAKAYEKFIGKIAQLLKHSASLHELGLRMNGIHAQALSTIAFALSANRGVEQLDLSGNPLCTRAADRAFSTSGIHDLAWALRDGAVVMDLDLSFCGIDERGADLLVRALADNRRLQRINLFGNPIPPKHAIFLNRRVVRTASIKPAE
jgi:hypothetical protein